MFLNLGRAIRSKHRYTFPPPPSSMEETDPSLALDSKSQAAHRLGKQSSIFSLPSSPFCWAHRRAGELTGIRGISSSASDSLPPPSACPFPSWAAGSVKQPEELRGELIGGGGRESQGRENRANQRGLSPWRAAYGTKSCSQ